MATYTPNLNLKKPSTGEYYDVVADLNDAKDKIDIKIGDALINTKGVLKPSLKARLDDEYNEILTRGLDWDRKGVIKLPDDFPKNLPFELYRNTQGDISHNFDFGFWDDAEVLYVKTGGSNDPDPSRGTSEFPYSTVKFAIEQAVVRAGSKWKIKIMDKVFRGWGMTPNVLHTFTINKHIKIMPAEGIAKVLIPSGNPGTSYTWSQDANVYYTTRSVLEHVYDSKFRDVRGNYVRLKNVETLAECKSSPNTYYYASNVVYVNRKDGSAPDDDIHLITQIETNFRFDIISRKLFFENLHFAYNSRIGGDQEGMWITGNAASEFIHKNCCFSASRKNGLAVDSAGATYGFESDAHNNYTDGFNYHDTYGGLPGFAFEYDCYASNNGNTSSSTFNATTAHDGMTVLRVGSVGHDCRGPILADVNGCYSVNIDCNMYDSLRSDGATRTGFWFDSALYITPKRGKAYLINCSGGGARTFTLNTDGEVDIFVKNLKGANIPNGVTLNQIV